MRRRSDPPMAECGRGSLRIWRCNPVFRWRNCGRGVNDSFRNSTYWACVQVVAARPCVLFLAALQQNRWCNAQVTLSSTCDSGWELPGKEISHVEIHCPPFSRLEALRRRRERACASQRPRIGRYRHQPLGYSATCMDRRAPRAIRTHGPSQTMQRPPQAGVAVFGFRAGGIGHRQTAC